MSDFAKPSLTQISLHGIEAACKLPARYTV